MFNYFFKKKIKVTKFKFPACAKSSAGRRDLSGFTIAELVVIMGIMGLMSVVVISNQNQSADQRKLTLETRRLTQDLRKAQNMALSATTQDCGGASNVAVPFGIILNMDIPDQYLLVADCYPPAEAPDYTSDHIYDSNNDNDPIVSSYVFADSMISDLNPKNASNALEVFFFPPGPGTAINTDESDGAIATIKLCGIRNPSLCQSIYVNSKGAISVQ